MTIIDKQHARLRHKKILKNLDLLYPRVRCALHYDGAFQLLVATILSAQCTDTRVNLVTPALFAKFGMAEKMAVATIAQIETLIRSTGFYHSKAKYISGAAKMIVEKFQGKVPRTMEAILMLPGVARKTANVVLSVGFGIRAGVVVDTHVSRLSGKLGLSDKKTPEKIEQDLMRIVAREKWNTFSLQLIQHGRLVCIARRPRCGECVLRTLCPSAGKFDKKIPQKRKAIRSSNALGVKLHAKKR